MTDHARPVVSFGKDAYVYILNEDVAETFAAALMRWCGDFLSALSALALEAVTVWRIVTVLRRQLVATTAMSSLVCQFASDGPAASPTAGFSRGNGFQVVRVDAHAMGALVPIAARRVRGVAEVADSMVRGDLPYHPFVSHNMGKSLFARPYRECCVASSVGASRPDPTWPHDLMSVDEGTVLVDIVPKTLLRRQPPCGM
jgi:hypothetical protein